MDKEKKERFLRVYQNLPLNERKNTILVFESKKEKPEKRGIKSRMSELTADYRSHTLNRKILLRFLKRIDPNVKIMKRKKVKKWLDNHPKKKKQLQDKVNKYIRTNFKIKFIPIQDKKDIISFEHFAIAVINPEYNG